MKNFIKFSFTFFLLLSLFSSAEAQLSDDEQFHMRVSTSEFNEETQCFTLRLIPVDGVGRYYSEEVCFDRESNCYKVPQVFDTHIGLSIASYTCVVTIEGFNPCPPDTGNM